ncbi:MAG TPA: DUF1207 domain-containing protein [Thioalkalivibrio sp.]|nr:DUF1207 domain-containing protein [Thioalkalivibrio sp.]
MTARHGLALFVLIGLLLGARAEAAESVLGDRHTDAYLAGYLTAMLERELGWERGSYELEVTNGVATVRLPFGDEQRQVQAIEGLGTVAGLQGLNVELMSPDEQPAAVERSFRKQAYRTLGLTGGMVPLPAGDLFSPLVADPKQPQFFVALRRYRTPVEDLTIGAVGYGENFGIYRQQGSRPGDGLQVGIAGALFAQFDMTAPSTDLVNADYTIGIPVSYRKGPLSARLRLYHQSSHLGDEFLLRVEPERVNLSYESLELLVSRDWARWRAYGGGEVLLRREPSDLERAGLHGGAEYRSQTIITGLGRLVGGVDVKSWQQNDWSPDVSFQAGVEFGRPDPGGRRFRVMLEAYDGHAPHGQFYEAEIAYVGMGLYLGF